MNSGFVLTAIIRNPDEDNKEISSTFISTRGRLRRQHQRKGKEEETTGEWKERETTNKMKLTRMCSNRFFTFIASYVGKNDSVHPSSSFLLPTAPPPPASWTESPHSLSPCLSHLASSMFYLMTLIPKLVLHPKLLFRGRSRSCSPPR
jgi:hypothetical protein